MSVSVQDPHDTASALTQARGQGAQDAPTTGNGNGNYSDQNPWYSPYMVSPSSSLPGLSSLSANDNTYIDSMAQEVANSSGQQISPGMYEQFIQNQAGADGQNFNSYLNNLISTNLAGSAEKGQTLAQSGQNADLYSAVIGPIAANGQLTQQQAQYQDNLSNYGQVTPPSQNDFLDKYGAPAILATGIGAFAGPAAGAALGAAGATGAVAAVGTGALAGAGTGALTTGIQGGNVGEGALIGGLAGGIGSGVTYGLGNSGAGLSSGVAGAGGKIAGSAVGSELGNAFSGSSTTGSGSSTMMNQGGAVSPGATLMGGNTMGGLYGTGGSTTGGTTAGSSATLGSSLSGLLGGNSSLLGGLAGLGSTIAGGISNNNIGSMQNNAYTTAGNAANSGNTWGTSGIGGAGAQFNNGQLSVTGGSLNPLASQFSSFGSQQLGQAQAVNQQMPFEVTNGYNSYMGNLGSAQTYAGQGQQAGSSLMGQGQNTLNSANSNYNSAYNTSLNSGLAALNPAIQQQSNALLNSNFERGMAGTSGGALQTQALQNSFNTANEQVQQNAVSQGLNAMNSTANIGLGEYNSGATNLGNFNNQSASLGSQGLQAGENYTMFQPQLSGAYQTNAQNAVSGFGGINQVGLQNAQVGLSSQTNVGNQMNTAARTQGQIANTYNGGTAGSIATALGGLSNNLLGSLFGGSSSGSSGSSLLSSLFGGGSSLASGLLGGNNYYGSSAATNSGVGYSNQYLNGQNTLGQGSLSPVGGTQYMSPGGTGGGSIDTGDMGDYLGNIDFGD